MSDPAVPDEIRLIAATSRLLDLHQSRRDQGGGVYVPEPAERAGVNLSVGLLVLTTLFEIERGSGEGYVAIPELCKAVVAKMPGIACEDVEFAMHSIAAAREVRYAYMNGEATPITAFTRNTTQLVEIADGFAQVRLTDNGRLWLRVRSLRDRWLYQDIDATKLHKAIEYERFDHVVEICDEMRVELASKNRTLTQMIERPALVELRDALIKDGARIAETLRRAKQAVLDAADLLYRPETEAAFIAWRRLSGAPFEIENLQAELILVTRTVEVFSRRFLDFLQSAQRVKHAGAERIRFLDIADHLVANGGADSGPYLEAAFENILPFGAHVQVFHPETLVGMIDFADLLGDENRNAAPSEMERDLAPATAHARLQSFVRRHRDMLVARLRQGPMRFSDLLHEHGLTLQPGESAVDFFGAYAAPDDFKCEDDEIVLGLSVGEHDFAVETHRYRGSDPLLILRKKV